MLSSSYFYFGGICSQLRIAVPRYLTPPSSYDMIGVYLLTVQIIPKLYRFNTVLIQYRILLQVFILTLPACHATKVIDIDYNGNLQNHT